jgi:hypothetical protein
VQPAPALHRRRHVALAKTRRRLFELRKVKAREGTRRMFQPLLKHSSGGGRRRRGKKSSYHQVLWRLRLWPGQRSNPTTSSARATSQRRRRLRRTTCARECRGKPNGREPPLDRNDVDFVPGESRGNDDGGGDGVAARRRLRGRDERREMRHRVAPAHSGSFSATNHKGDTVTTLFFNSQRSRRPGRRCRRRRRLRGCAVFAFTTKSH